MDVEALAALEYIATKSSAAFGSKSGPAFSQHHTFSRLLWLWSCGTASFLLVCVGFTLTVWITDPLSDLWGCNCRGRPVAAGPGYCCRHRSSCTCMEGKTCDSDVLWTVILIQEYFCTRKLPASRHRPEVCDFCHTFCLIKILFML